MTLTVTHPAPATHPAPGTRPPASTHSARIPAPIGTVRPDDLVWDRAPMIVYWELTLACQLVCRHCRAKAMRRALPGELTHAQALGVLDDILDFGDPLPHLILTGGDPLEREDLFDLMDAARERGIGVSVSPSVTPRLTREALHRMHASGAQAISLSLDGSDPAHHDAIRRVPGTFDATLEALDDARDAGLCVQINTLVSATTADDLPAIHRLLLERGAGVVSRWTLFFLIHTGRGVMMEEVSPDRGEEILTWAASLRATSPFPVSTTEALHHRRVLAQEMEARGWDRARIQASPAARSFGVRDGNGIVFIDHLGNVTPSGFLPLTIGSLKGSSLVDLYRDAPLMHALRDPSGFGGKCGQCEYNTWCGGGRARAWAATGDPLASDPLCPYLPGHR